MILNTYDSRQMLWTKQLIKLKSLHKQANLMIKPNRMFMNNTSTWDQRIALRESIITPSKPVQRSIA